MAAKKAAAALHVKHKEFFHPRIDHPSILVLKKVEDPRNTKLQK